MSDALVTTDPLDAAALRARVATPHDGAVVVFEGIVRDHDGGRDVTALEYEAHPEAQRFLEEACDRAIAATPGIRLAAAHRVGPLSVGDVALVAVVASAHRAEAFAACAALVDDIKQSVPIWKRQRFSGADGGAYSEWVGL